MHCVPTRSKGIQSSINRCRIHAIKQSTWQVEGKDGFKVLMGKVRAHGPGVLYHGALAGKCYLTYVRIMIKRRSDRRAHGV